MPVKITFFLSLNEVDKGNGLVTVNLYADGFTDITGFQFSLSFNNNGYNFSSVAYNEKLDYVASANFFNGIVNFVSVLSEKTTLQNNEAILSITFIKVGDVALSPQLVLNPQSPAVVPEFTAFPAKLVCPLSNDFETPNLGTTVSGNVFIDLDKNCVADGGASAFDWKIKVESPSSTKLYNARKDGSFFVHLDETGSHTITSIPGNDKWTSCKIDTIVTIDTLIQQSIAVNFLAQPNGQQCPETEISISTSFLRRCFENTFKVEYANSGNAALENTKVEIVLDEDFDFVSCLLPHTLNGSILSIDLGTLPPMSQSSFLFTVIPNCDNTILGETHCVEARISPQYDCELPSYNGPKLDLSAQCKNDTFSFLVTNVSPHNMVEAVNCIVVEDDIMKAILPIQLNANQVFKYEEPASNSTLRMIVQQIQGYPNQTFLTKAIEGCGSVDFNTGFVTNFAESDEEPFVDIFCIQNIGSFDPNDISVTPSGFSQNKYVFPNVTLEYLIRFQNTGTDTAINITINDTIDSHLDLATFQLIESSHPVNISTDQNRVVKFRYSNIYLPDSFKNEAASNGYVRYNIKPLKDIDNVEVLNSANIYFDYNAPVSTNRLKQNIYSNWFLTGTHNDEEDDNLLTVFPNPSSTSIFFKFQQAGQAKVTLYNNSGHKIDHFVVSQKNNEYNVAHLNGFYVCSVQFENGLTLLKKIFINNPKY